MSRPTKGKNLMCAPLRWSFPWSLCLAVLALCSFVQSAGINVDVPEEFYQCQPAVIGITGARGNVSIVVREAHTKHAHLNVSLPTNETQFTWAAVDLAAGTNFALIITDRTTKNRTKLSQSIQHSTVDLPVTGINDTSCLPVKEGKKGKNGDDSDQGKDVGDGDDDSGGDPSLADDANGHRKKHSTIEISVIAGVLGGLLFVLMLLILVMCLRRRRETHVAPDDNDSFMQHQQQHLQLMSQRGSILPLGAGNAGDEYVTLADGSRRRIASIVMARQDDAGWRYMSSLVPGLEASEGSRGHHRLQSRAANGQRQSQQRRGLRTKRYDSDANDAELPSYGLSEYERKHLPKYEGREEAGAYEDAGLESDHLVMAREPSSGSARTDEEGLTRSSTLQSVQSRNTRQTYYSRASSAGAPFIYDLDQPSRESGAPSGAESDVGLAYLDDDEQEDPNVITFHATPSAHTMGPNGGNQSRSVSIVGVPPHDQQPRSILTRNLMANSFVGAPEERQSSPGASTALSPINGRNHLRNRSDANSAFDWDRPSS